MIFDTNFIIDLMEDESHAVEKLKEVVEKNQLQITTAPTVFELYSGLARSTKADIEKEKILYVISNLLIWHLDTKSAEKAGEIDGSLIKEGRKIDPIDSMIAGIAIATGETVITRNMKHFSRIAGLKIESY